MRLLVVAAILVTAGCAHAPSTLEQAQADYGPYPNRYEDIIRTYMSSRLKDPYSAQYEFVKGPTQMWTAGNLRSTKYGYGICTYINAKNSFGGYTGRRLYFFLINNGEVVRDMGGDSDLDESMAEKMCKGSW